MRTTQKDIAHRLGLDVSSVNKILNHKKGAIFRKETIQDVHKAACALGFDFEKLKHAHRRAEARKDLSLEVKLTIYNADGSVFDRGTAVARNVSLSGAFLTALVLPQRALPLGACTIGIQGAEGALKDLEIMGQPVRLRGDEWGINLAVTFLPKEKVKAKRMLSRA